MTVAAALQESSLRSLPLLARALLLLLVVLTLVWGTNWPHPNAERLPDDAALLDALARG